MQKYYAIKITKCLRRAKDAKSIITLIAQNLLGRATNNAKKICHYVINSTKGLLTGRADNAKTIPGIC